MRFKKRLSAAAAVVVMAASVFCGSIWGMGETEETEAPITFFGQKETIHFWYSDESLTNFLNSAAVAFGEREGVRVFPKLVSENEYLEAVSRASLDSGHSQQMPDAYIVSHDFLEKAYLAGLAARIQDAAGVCNEKYFPKAALSAAAYKDKLIGYPLFFETSALVYNKTYLRQWAEQMAWRELQGGEEGAEVSQEGIPVDEALLAAKTEEYFGNAIPSKIEDILNIAYTFDVSAGVEGILKWDVSDIFYNYWFVGNYMTVGGEAGDDPAEIDINNPETIQCLEVYKELNQFFYIESDNVDYESVMMDFCEGKTVFTIATTDVVKRLEDAKAEGLFEFEYGIARMPKVSETLSARSMSVTNVIAINGYSRHKALANSFAAYLAEECAEELYGRTGRVSANLNADKDNEALQVFKSEYADSRPLPKMMETANFWMQLESLFSKIWNGADVAELVRELEDDMMIQVR